MIQHVVEISAAFTAAGIGELAGSATSMRGRRHFLFEKPSSDSSRKAWRGTGDIGKPASKASAAVSRQHRYRR